MATSLVSNPAAAVYGTVLAGAMIAAEGSVHPTVGHLARAVIATLVCTGWRTPTRS